MKKLPRVVTIGGGTGSYSALLGLKNHPIKLSAIVNMIDDGGSSGVLRDELGVLPPGDVRQCLVALSESSTTLRKLFNYRFEEGSLKGHTFGNIFLSALEKETGSFKKSISEVGKILRINGNVIPVTFTKSALCAELVDGSIITGQHHVDVVEKKEKRSPIKKVYLKPHAKLNPDAKKAIIEADYILIGPGDIYTSVIPNLLVDDLPQIIKKSKAKKIFVMNLMTKYGQTTGLGAKKHITVLEKYLGENILDIVLINSGKASKKVLHWYEGFEEHPVKDDLGNDNAIIRVDLLREVSEEKSTSDKIRRSLIRHDSKKLSNAIIEIVNSS